jgi:hypothetical protein
VQWQRGVNYVRELFSAPRVDESQTAPPRVILPTKTVSAKEEWAQRKRFAEHVIHPALLTVLPLPSSISIAVDRQKNPRANSIDGNQLAKDLLFEVAMYKGIDRITVIFVDKEDSEHGTNSSECPRLLTDFLASAGRRDIDMECAYINPYDDKHDTVTRDHDVSFVLANCGQDKLDRETRKSKWEEVLYAKTTSVAVKCVGRTYPLDHPVRLAKSNNGGKSSNIDQIEHYFVPDLRDNPYSDSFLHATDYDISDKRGITTNFAVAFRSIQNGVEQWRLPEANYQVAMHQRWGPSVKDVHFFHAADMALIQFPSRHSSVSSCDHYKHLLEGRDLDDDEDDEMFCEHGLDPQYPNVPAENFYMAKSTAGENAGRGVFTSIDLKVGEYLMAESVAHDIVFSFRGFKIAEEMVGSFCLPKKESESNRQTVRLDSFQCIVGIYYDSYGYNGIQRGVPVHTGKNMFINHGCNGSANICDYYAGIEDTEFSMIPEDGDPDPETFVIPFDFRMTKFYNPNFERNIHILRYDMADSYAISANTEILDNYVDFGGEKYFLAQVVTLKEQCEGKAGTVVAYEDNKELSGHKFDILGSPFVMDYDASLLRQHEDNRRIGRKKLKKKAQQALKNKNQ